MYGCEILMLTLMEERKDEGVREQITEENGEVRVASRGHFSEKGCVSVASQAV